MDQIKRLKAEIEELQTRLRQETLRRMELERRCSLLEKLAYRDPTTGLCTESYLRSRVREEIERSIRFPSATTLVTLCAPVSRDNSLTHLGQRLTDELRSTDQVFRLSEHGLAMLLVETPEEGAHQVLTRLREELEQFVRGYGFTVTSFPVHANLADEFLNLALDRHREMARRVRPEDHTFGNQALHSTVH